MKFKGAGGEICFKTVIQSRSVLPEHVSVNNGVYKYLFNVVSIFEKTVRSSIPSLPQNVVGGEESSQSLEGLVMVYVHVMNAFLCCHLQLAVSAAAEALCRAQNG